MSGFSSMSRRDRTILVAVALVAVLGFAAFCFVRGLGDWSVARKKYEKQTEKLDAQRHLIADREEWAERLERSQLQMPMIDTDELPATRWKRVVGTIARDHGFQILGYNNDGVEEDQGEVWELALDIQFRSSLRRLVEFLYALDTSDEGLFDVRQLEISTKRPGELTGKFTLTCAYKKGTSE